MTNKLTIIISLITILLCVPFPPVVLKILYYLDSFFALFIFEVCMFSIFKKGYPKRIPRILHPLVMYFSLYSMTLNISTIKLILSTQDKQDNLSLISKFTQKGFLTFPYVGYIIFVCLIFLVIFMLYKNKELENENLTDSIKFLKAAVKLFFLTFFVSLINGTIIGLLKENLSFKDSFLLYFSYSSAIITLYLVNLICAHIGICSLMFVIQNKINYFNNTDSL